MRIKKTGPTLLAGDVMVPLDRLSETLRKMKKELESRGLRFGIEGSIPSKRIAVVMPMYLSDERKPIKMIFALRHMSKINKIAISSGGKPYGIGLWNLPYISSIMSKKLRKIETFSKKFHQKLESLFEIQINICG